MATRAVVSAGSIAPQAYAHDDGNEAPEDVQYDLYNLLLVDHHAVNRADFEEDKEDYLHQRASEGAQRLINRLFALETENSDVGPLALLPAGITRLPREKHIPEEKAETRWEKFAKDKGIKKRKRERMVWDETFQEFRPSWGYKRANNGDLDMAIVEVKAGQNANEDPWSKAMQQKKDRVKKNLKHQEKNLIHAAAARSKGKPSIPLGIPVELSNAAEPKLKKRGKEKTMDTLRTVQFSTASIGRFDKAVEGEPERKKKGVRRQFRPVVGALADEQSAAHRALKSIAINSDKKARKVTNSLEQYEGIIPDAGPKFTDKKRITAVAKMKPKGKAGKGKGRK